MYRVTIDGVELEVKFGHGWIFGRNAQELTPAMDSANHRRTVCWIDFSGRRVSSGVANCSRVDQFCRATGRKLALTRAVAGLPKHVRKAIWDGYWRATARRINAFLTERSLRSRRDGAAPDDEALPDVPTTSMRVHYRDRWG